jgi:hypothetical protein
MPLPTSGTLTLQDIENEFGGSGAIDLSEYYAGGTYVPFGTEGINGPIPTSGRIDISDFYGAPFAAPEPVINFSIRTGQGDDDNTTFGEPSYVFGYSRVWGLSAPTDEYGTINSGNNISDDGWGIDTISLIETYGVVPKSHGFIINWTNANFLNDRFTFDIDDGDIPFTLDTRNADVDDWVTVQDRFGNKNVRTCFWNFTPGNGYFPYWETGNINSIRAENLSA